MEPKEAKEACPDTLPRTRVYWHGVLSRCVCVGGGGQPMRSKAFMAQLKNQLRTPPTLPWVQMSIAYFGWSCKAWGRWPATLTLPRINLHTPDISFSVMFGTKCIKASVLHSEAWHWVGAGVSESGKRLLSFCTKSELRIVAHRCVFGASKRHTLPPFPDKWAFWVLTDN